MDHLSPIEARLIGVLIEKALTTPDQYPMSLNALVTGSNQKSNRNPAMSLSEEQVFDALADLRARDWVMMVMPSSGRVERYKRSVKEKLGVDGWQEAVLAELLLRGPQTVGELRTRCGRMKPFESLEIVQNVLDGLAAPADEREALVKRIGPAPGGRADRWMQLVAPDSHPQDAPAAAATPSPVARAATPSADSAAQIRHLEERIASLEATVEELRQLLPHMAD